MNTATRPMYEWSTINWKKIQQNVFKLQKRIYQASQRGDVTSMRKLQKLLLKSNGAKLLAIRKVTQDNQGKKTAGVDGVRSLSPVQRMKLSKLNLLEAKVKPTRRIWIPKPNSNEKRPLGIPVMKDRAAQALVKLALEPEWEARFEANSYGFRPGRSVHDAIEAIFLSIRSVPKYVLDADIEKCFDRISHEKLLGKLNTIPSLRQLIKAWLKAGVLEDDVFNPTEQGTPQGGVISPLLANIALHGMEQVVKNKFPISRGGPILIRYADDFLVFHKDLTVVHQCKEALEIWLSELGLNLKQEKTRIVHTLNKDENGDRGFDFLGMYIAQYQTGKTHSGRNNRGESLGFKTLTKTSPKSQKKQQTSIKKMYQPRKTHSKQ